MNKSPPLKHQTTLYQSKKPTPVKRFSKPNFVQDTSRLAFLPWAEFAETSQCQNLALNKRWFTLQNALFAVLILGHHLIIPFVCV